MIFRLALWFLLLFALAVAAAWFGRNDAVVSLFWSPWRVDVRLNVLLVALVVGAGCVWFVWRGLAALPQLPAARRAQRIEQQRLALVTELAQGLLAKQAGSAARAHQHAQAALQAAQQLQALESANHANAAADGAWPRVDLQTVAELLAAETARAVQDSAQDIAARDAHHGLQQ